VAVADVYRICEYTPYFFLGSQIVIRPAQHECVIGSQLLLTLGDNPLPFSQLRENYLNYYYIKFCQSQ
jgi:hypothetical protein